MSLALLASAATLGDFGPALLSQGLVAARVLPLGLALARLSRGAVPLWLALALSLALAAGLASGLDVSALSEAAPSAWALALVRELLLGAAFALVSLVPFWALATGLRVVDRALLPTGAGLERFYVFAAALLTLSLGGHRAFVRALGDSLRALPVGQTLPAKGALLAELFALVTSALNAVLSLALPLWMALLLLDLCLALVARALERPSDPRRSALRGSAWLVLLAVLLAPVASRLPELTRSAVRAAGASMRRLSP